MRIRPIAITVIALITLGGYFEVLRRGELGDKPINADLQAIELHHRNSALTKPVIIEDPHLGTVIGVPTIDHHFPNFWVAASVIRSDGTPYIMGPRPDRLRISCSAVDPLLSGAELKKPPPPGIREFLRAHCEA
jgi:hypothetical protein